MNERDQTIKTMMEEKDTLVNKLQEEKHQVLAQLINEKDDALRKLTSERDDQVVNMISERDDAVGKILTEKDQFVQKLINEKNQVITRLSMEKEKLVTRLRDEYSLNQNKLKGEMDARHEKQSKSADVQIQAMKIMYEVQTEKVNKEITGFRKDLEVFKTNLIAAGQMTASFSLSDGNRLQQIVNKLQTDFDYFVKDSNERQVEIQQDLANKVASFMTETQGVFDSLLQDISALQKTVNTFQESHDLENLETHLTERIATLTENAMEATAVQGESLDSLNDKVRELSMIITDQASKNKEDLTAHVESLQSKMGDVQESIATMRGDNSKKFEDSYNRLNTISHDHSIFVAQIESFESLKAQLTLSVTDRNRLDELTDFYRHLNGVIETIIDRFSTVERTMKKFINMKQMTPSFTPGSPLRTITEASRVSEQALSLKPNPVTTPLRLAPSQIAFEEKKQEPEMQKVRGQDIEPAASPKKEVLGLANQGTANTEVPFDTMLPAIHEEFKGIDLKSAGSVVVTVPSKGSKKSLSQHRRSAAPSTYRDEELKSKVSKMMSNHQMLVDDLKSQSAKRSSTKRQSLANASERLEASLAAAAKLPAMDDLSVDTLAKEIDAYGKTLDKDTSAPVSKRGLSKHSRNSRKSSVTSAKR